MYTKRLTLPELVMIAATRGLLGAGIGLLVADRLSREQRRTAGLVLTGIGALSTVPLAFGVLGRRSAGKGAWRGRVLGRRDQHWTPPRVDTDSLSRNAGL